MKSSRQAPFLGRAALSAAHPVLMGFAAAPAIDLWGIEGADHWDRGGLVRYRSRRDLMKQGEAITEEGGDDVHAFKVAAIEKTIAYPLDPWFQLGDPRFVFALAFAVIGLSVKAFSKSEAAPGVEVPLRTSTRSKVGLPCSRHLAALEGRDAERVTFPGGAPRVSSPAWRSVSGPLSSTWTMSRLSGQALPLRPGWCQLEKRTVGPSPVQFGPP